MNMQQSESDNNPNENSMASDQSLGQIKMEPGTSSVTESKMPVQSFSDFLGQLEDYVPTIPDSVAVSFLQSAGFESSDPRVVRLISLAAQKFVSDIANDAYQHCKTRGVLQPISKSKGKDRKFILTLEDLSTALQEYGIVVKKPHYFV